MPDRRPKIPDSPKDGTSYVRKDGQWEVSVSTSGATGGSGTAASPGANQYIELTIGNLTYKVLHDGLVQEQEVTDNPPDIINTPNPRFTQGTASDYSMASFYTDDGVTPVTTALSGTLASGLSYNGTTHVLSYDGVGAVSTSSNISLEVTDGTGTVTSALFDIEIESPAQPVSWPLNGWAMYGGYMISSQGDQFTNFPLGLPMLDWNSEKDVLIIQGLGWRNAAILDSAAERFKTLKTISPNTKILYYYIASEPSKTISGGVVGYNEETKEMIESGTRGEINSWYLRTENDAKLESQFNPVLFHRSNCYATQLQSVNSLGRTFDQQFLQEHYDNFTTVRSNGETLLSLTDGLYWDVADCIPENVYLDGSNGATSDSADYNMDGAITALDSKTNETTPVDPNDEDAYGAARIHRRGIANWVSTFESIFPTGYVLSGNGTKDGVVYDIGGLSSGDPMDENELYQLMDGTIHERIGNSVGTDDTGTGYTFQFNPSVETGVKRHLFMLERIKTKATHPWGSPYGRTGSHLMVLDMNTRATEAQITATDYEYAEFYAGLNALCGTCFAPYMNTGDPFPRPDSYIYDWGDPIDVDYPERMGTVNPALSGMNVTLRAYDYVSGNGDFWWQEFDNCLWVVRADSTGFSSGDTWGGGTGIACQLPNPGTGKKWIYPDFGNYTNPNTGWTTRDQLPAIYNFSDVESGGTYGQITMKPMTARMLIRVDDSVGPPVDPGSDITLLNSWTFVDDDDPQGQTFSVSAGTNRVLVLAYAGPNHDISAFGWGTPTVTYGGESPTATYKFGDGNNDSARYFAIWNDAAITAAASTSFAWSGTAIVNEFFGAGSYENVAQTGLGTLAADSSNNTGNASSTTLTTTSSSGDRILVVGGLNTGSKQVSDWDTLSELHDVAASSGNAKYCFGEGNGGDSSTVITNTTFCRPNFASIVLKKG